MGIQQYFAPVTNPKNPVVIEDDADDAVANPKGTGMNGSECTISPDGSRCAIHMFNTRVVAALLRTVQGALVSELKTTYVDGDVSAHGCSFSPDGKLILTVIGHYWMPEDFAQIGPQRASLWDATNGPSFVYSADPMTPCSAASRPTEQCCYPTIARAHVSSEALHPRRGRRKYRPYGAPEQVCCWTRLCWGCGGWSSKGLWRCWTSH